MRNLRGKDFNYAVVYPGWTAKVNVLSVPKYDFHQQLAYDLDRPLALPAGSKLVITAHYDNSLKMNICNITTTALTPQELGPDKEVHFRDAIRAGRMFSPIHPILP